MNRLSALQPTPIERVLSPFQRFAHTESSGGVVLLACTIIALIWANSPASSTYFELWEIELGIGTEGLMLRKTLHHWINDGLMVVFFFLVGLEIKRELVFGELSSVKAATLPIAAAIGGMVVPAALYALINARGPGAAGWGIPMATDIAFALGVLALLGPGVPSGLKVFLAAFAIVDDLGAVLVIALFYTATISWAALGAAVAVVGLLVLLNRLSVRHPGVYALVGVVLWLLFLKSGVHATVAGVLLAATIPVRTRIDSSDFLTRSRILLDDFESSDQDSTSVLTNSGQQEALRALEAACEQAQSPLQRIEAGLHGWVAFGIMPLFALANAGVRFAGLSLGVVLSPIAVGIILGLVIGKPVGITLFAWLTCRANLAAPPAEVRWRSLHGVSWLGGIGFTMSLFIATLAFGDGPLMDEAKIGILAASFLAGVVGWILLRRDLR